MCEQDSKSVFKELNGFPYEMHVFREMQFVSHCYTVVSCQPISRHSVYKISAVYPSGARVRLFLRDTRFGFPDTLVYRNNRLTTPRGLRRKARKKKKDCSLRQLCPPPRGRDSGKVTTAHGKPLKTVGSDSFNLTVSLYCGRNLLYEILELTLVSVRKKLWYHLTVV